jgi:uncharacterized protein
MKYKLRNVAFTIIIINVVMFILQQVIPGMTEALLLDSSRVLSAPWILFTSMFLHADVWHLVFNMYALLIFGTLIEQRMGSNRFLGAYLVSGIIAAAVTTMFYPSALGASGAIMSILGLTIMLLPDLQVLFFFVIPMSMRTAGIMFAAFDIIGSITGAFGPIAHIAHLIGLACGLAYGYYLLKRKKKIMHKVLGVEYEPPSAEYKLAHKKKTAKKNTIELTDDELEEYMNRGHL